VETVEDGCKERAHDEALIARFRRGDAAAFDDIVREHRREIYGVARRILGSHEDADEAAQEAFLRAWRALDRFRGEAALRTWLIRIVLNVSRTMLTKRRESRSLEEAGGISAAGPGAEERLGCDELSRRVREAVTRLPPRQREVVLLKVFSGLTYHEVARVMEISEGAVKAHLHQAVSNLRRRMD
jgi:RNA polymerase sigma-70 factor (ECF subfamily)